MAMPSTDEWGLVRSDQEEAEESYFISMTDIMVGLLFIFIIMLMAFGLMLKAATQEVIEGPRQAEKHRAEMLESIQRSLEQRGIEVVLDKDNGVLRLPDEILFAKGESSLSKEGLEAIGKLGRTLDVVLPCYAVLRPGATRPASCEAVGTEAYKLEAVFVEGHTDSDGTQAFNWNLSTERAVNTYRALQERSALATRLLNPADQHLFSVSGYGENRPVREGTSSEAMQQNRRIDLRFVMHYIGDPGDAALSAKGRAD